MSPKSKFIESSVADALLMAQVGFELETQRTDGKRAEDCRDDDADQESARESAHESWRDADTAVEYLANNCDLQYDQARRVYRAMASAQSERGMAVLKDAFAIDEDDWIDSEAENNYQSCDSSSSAPSDILDVPDGIEADVDPSVRGFEFKPRGPVTVERAEELVGELFNMSHTIDTNCSFHVHVSVPGMTHQYGEKFQASIYAALIRRIDRVPESVLKRWSSSAIRYFGFELKSDKFSFVNFHRGFGSWEFRGFGNVHDAHDARTCITLAVESLHAAYRLHLDPMSRLPGDAYTSDWLAERARTELKRRDLAAQLDTPQAA